MAERLWLVFAIAGIVATAAYFVMPPIVESFLYDGISLAPVLAIAAGVRRHQPQRKRVWTLLACGLALAGAGNVYLTYHQLAFHTQPFPSAADVLYLLGDVALIGAMAALIGSRARRADRAAMIDSLIIALGVGILVWAFWMSHYAHEPDLSLLQKAISLAYPLIDVVLIASAARLALGSGERAVSLYVLGLGLLILLGADVAFGLTVLAGTYYPGCVVDAGFLLAYVLFGAAGLHPSMRAISGPALRDHMTLSRGRLICLALAALVGPVVLGIQSLTGGVIDGRVLRCTSLAVFMLVLWRMWGLTLLLNEAAATRARAMERERTLRAAAAGLVGASDRQVVFDVACEAIAAVVHEGDGSDITGWSVSGGTAAAIAGVVHRDAGAPAARVPLRALPADVEG